MRKVEGKIYWATHELASSRRTEGFPLYFLSEKGEILGRFEAEKRNGSVEIPEGSEYLARYYETNAGYMVITFFKIPGRDGWLFQIGQYDSYTGVLAVDHSCLVKPFVKFLRELDIIPARIREPEPWWEE